MKLLVVLGSVREARAGAKVLDWVLSRLADKQDIEVTVADLAKIDLPMAMEQTIPSGIKDFEYESEDTKRWSDMVRSSDAVLIITPEYNHSVSAPLKNALDHLYYEWEGKPVGLVGYGTRGALDAAKHLEWIANFLKYQVVEPKVAIPKVWEAFNDSGELANHQEHAENLDKIIETLLKLHSV